MTHVLERGFLCKFHLLCDANNELEGTVGWSDHKISSRMAKASMILFLKTQRIKKSGLAKQAWTEAYEMSSTGTLPSQGGLYFEHGHASRKLPQGFSAPQTVALEPSWISVPSSIAPSIHYHTSMGSPIPHQSLLLDA